MSSPVNNKAKTGPSRAISLVTNRAKTAASNPANNKAKTEPSRASSLANNKAKTEPSRASSPASLLARGRKVENKAASLARVQADPSQNKARKEIAVAAERTRPVVGGPIPQEPISSNRTANRVMAKEQAMPVKKLPSHSKQTIRLSRMRRRQQTSS